MFDTLVKHVCVKLECVLNELMTGFEININNKYHLKWIHFISHIQHMYSFLEVHKNDTTYVICGKNKYEQYIEEYVSPEEASGYNHIIFSVEIVSKIKLNEILIQTVNTTILQSDFNRVDLITGYTNLHNRMNKIYGQDYRFKFNFEHVHDCDGSSSETYYGVKIINSGFELIIY